MVDVDPSSSRLTMLYKVSYLAIGIQGNKHLKLQRLELNATSECHICTFSYRWYIGRRQVMPGSCDRSFGIHVARIADFPMSVVSEAGELADALERGESLQGHLVERHAT